MKWYAGADNGVGAFRAAAEKRGIDPAAGATAYEARMVEAQRAGRWKVEGKGRLKFYTAISYQPSAFSQKPPQREQPVRFDAEDLTPRGMSAEQVVDHSPDLMPADGVSLRLLYAETKAEWERARRHERPLKQVNADRRRFEELRALEIRGLTRV